MNLRHAHDESYYCLPAGYPRFRCRAETQAVPYTKACNLENISILFLFALKL